MAEITEQVKQAVQILAQIADRALVDGPSGRQRDQAVQVLAEPAGLSTDSSNNPPIQMPTEGEAGDVESN